jgi:hypothetical protein
MVASIPQLELWTKGAAALEIIQRLIPQPGRVRLVPWSIPDPVVRTKDVYSDKVVARFADAGFFFLLWLSWWPLPT